MRRTKPRRPAPRRQPRRLDPRPGRNFTARTGHLKGCFTTCAAGLPTRREKGGQAGWRVGTPATLQVLKHLLSAEVRNHLPERPREHESSRPTGSRCARSSGRGRPCACDSRLPGHSQPARGFVLPVCADVQPVCGRGAAVPRDMEGVGPGGLEGFAMPPVRVRRFGPGSSDKAARARHGTVNHRRWSLSP